MDDPAYKLLFARPRMVRDLLAGFAARNWSGALDFDSLTAMPTGYVSRGLRQRHGDAVWRVRIRDERWLYLVLLPVEFQSTDDRAMAVRLLTYTGLYEKLIGDGVLRDHGALPPVLPVVIYNGSRPWRAAANVADLIASGSTADLAPYQPSQRYFLLDEGRAGDAELPPDNLVSALIALEANRDPTRLPALLKTLSALLREQGDAELTRAFRAWVEQVLTPQRFPRAVSGSLERLEEVRTMLEETVREWTAQWMAEGREQGIEQGIEQGRAEERALLCRQAARKFDAGVGRRLADMLTGVTDPDRLAEVGDCIIECGTAADLFARVQDAGRPGD